MAEGTFSAAAPPPAAAPGRGGRGGAGGRGVRLTSARTPPPLPLSVLDSAGFDEAEPPVDRSMFNPAAPAHFYLPDASCEALADSFAIVEGARLPLHSAVLAMQSKVLRDLFLQLREPQGGAAASQEPVELSSTFSGCTLQQAACFLRLIYSPNHATLAGLGALHQADAALLPALTRLAHRLDAGTLLAKLEACLQGSAASAAVPELLSTLQLAEVHHLEGVRASCLQLLARRLAGAGPFWQEQASVAQLAECSPHSLARLVGEVAGAAHAGGFDPPQVFGIGRGRGGRAGGFTFLLHNVMRRSSGRVTSPWVEVGGLEWRLKIWPGRDNAAGGTHLSGYLEANIAQMQAKGLASVQAFYEFAFLDQSGAGVHHVVDCGKDAFNLATANWGKTQMRPRSVLVDPSNHFLENDRLAVRISIRVKPPGPVAGGAAAVADGNASDEDEGGVAVVGL